MTKVMVTVMATSQVLATFWCPHTLETHGGGTVESERTFKSVTLSPSWPLETISRNACLFFSVFVCVSPPLPGTRKRPRSPNLRPHPMKYCIIVIKIPHTGDKESVDRCG